MTDEITIDKLVAIDRKMSAVLEEKQAELDAIEAQRKEVRATILSIMNERNEDSVRTAHGTVTRSVRERFWTNDWNTFGKYVIEHGAVELLEKRIHQSNMRTWIDENPNDFPPNVNVDREYTVTIRKPKKGASDD